MTLLKRFSIKSDVINESGNQNLSVDECEMSRSCQSATFSIAGIEYERIILANPVIFSVRIGFRL